MVTVSHCWFLVAFSANGKDVIVDFPQQSHWTGLLSEMELVPSVHPGVRYRPGESHLCSVCLSVSLPSQCLCVCVCHRCDGCQMFPINGPRFKCRNCEDFDFCENCFKTCKHNSRHLFGRINEPGERFSFDSSHFFTSTFLPWDRSEVADL